MKLALDQRFALRRSKTEALLQNLETGSNFILENDQLEFIQSLDGTKTIEEMRSEYDDDSQSAISAFINTLSNVGALAHSENCRVEMPLPVPDRRLEAVHFEPSGVCNMLCAHCYQGTLIKDGTYLSDKTVERLLDEMEQLQVSSVSISGGEPLMMLRIASLLQEIERRRIYLSALFTNGLLANEKAVSMLNTLKYKIPLYLNLDSLPGYPFQFRGFDGKNSDRVLTTIIANIRLLVNSGFRVTVNTVVNSENIHILEKMHDLMGEIGIFNWRLGFPKMTQNFKNHLEFAADWNAIAEHCFSILKRHVSAKQPFSLQVEYMYRDILFEQGLPNLTTQDFVCDYEGRRREVNIKPNGDVVSCAYCNDLPVGNVQKQSLWDIWYSTEMQKIKDIRIGQVRDCVGCDLINVCGTGCRANAFFLNGDFHNSRDDYACHAVKFFTQEVRPFLIEHGILT